MFATALSLMLATAAASEPVATHAFMDFACAPASGEDHSVSFDYSISLYRNTIEGVNDADAMLTNISGIKGMSDSYTFQKAQLMWVASPPGGEDTLFLMLHTPNTSKDAKVRPNLTGSILLRRLAERNERGNSLEHESSRVSFSMIGEDQSRTRYDLTCTQTFSETEK